MITAQVTAEVGVSNHGNNITQGFKHILTTNESTVNSNIKESHLPSSFFVKVDLIREKAQEHSTH
jgi:hypothetical protein